MQYDDRRTKNDPEFYCAAGHRLMVSQTDSRRPAEQSRAHRGQSQRWMSRALHGSGVTMQRAAPCSEIGMHAACSETDLDLSQTDRCSTQIILCRTAYTVLYCIRSTTISYHGELLRFSHYTTVQRMYPNEPARMRANEHPGPRQSTVSRTAPSQRRISAHALIIPWHCNSNFNCAFNRRPSPGFWPRK